MKRAFDNLLLMIAAFAIALGTLEVALRLIQAVKNRPYYVWQPDQHYTFHPDPEVFYGVKGLKHFSINSKGFRGKEFAEKDAKYITIGGSTTECLYLDDSETWTALLQ